MDAATVKNKLIAVLDQIQADSGLECPVLTGTIRPIDSLPEFDSKIWPVATTILATEIAAEIPDDVNIFVDETSKLARSIDEVAVFVCALVEKAKKKEDLAAAA